MRRIEEIHLAEWDYLGAMRQLHKHTASPGDTFREGYHNPELMRGLTTFLSRQDVARGPRDWPKQRQRRRSRRKRGPEQAPAWKG